MTLYSWRETRASEDGGLALGGVPAAAAGGATNHRRASY